MTTIRGYLRLGGRYRLWSAAIILALTAGWLIYMRFSMPKAYGYAPFSYTAVYTEKVFDDTGTLRATDLYSVAVRSDGSRMMKYSGPRGAETVAVRTIHFANGDEIRINEISERKSTFPRLHDGGPTLRDPESLCVQNQNEAVVGEGTIGGYRTVQIKAGSLTNWYALDQGCAMVQSRFEHDSGVTERIFISLIPGEPDGALFRAPASFLEVPPSQLSSYQDAEDSKGGAAPSTRSQAQAIYLQRLDQLYYGCQAKANR